MPTMSIEKSFCTTREAANLLGISVGTAQTWVENGLLDAWKTVGGHRRVTRDSVDRLLRKVPSTKTLPPNADVLVNQKRQLRVVVVDDDPILLRLYRANLASWPFAPEIVCLDDAVSALMLLGRGGPDLLITDLHMPGMDGFNMLRVLSYAPEMANTKVVVVSGLDAAAIAERGGVPDGVEVLGKPIPFDYLKKIAAEIVQKNWLKPQVV